MPSVVNTHFHNPHMYMITTFVVASELQISAYCNKIQPIIECNNGS